MTTAPNSFQGKRVLVTGAGKGIGRAIAEALYKQGATVVALSRTQDDLDSLKKQMPSMETVNQDISDWESTRKTVDSLGHFDYLVNNAGISSYRDTFLDIEKKEIDRIFNTNFFGTFNISQIVAKKMVEAGKGGSIVNISSVAAQAPIMDNLSAYAASKAALDSLTRAMALELGPHKIRVNSVNPTGVITGSVAMEDIKELPSVKTAMDRTPLKRFATLDDITGPVLFLLSDQSAMITGISMLVDGGLLCH